MALINYDASTKYNTGSIDSLLATIENNYPKQIRAPLDRSPSWNYPRELSLVQRVELGIKKGSYFISKRVSSVGNYLAYSNASKALKWTGIPFLLKEFPKFTWRANVLGVLPQDVQLGMARRAGHHRLSYCIPSYTWGIADKTSEFFIAGALASGASIPIIGSSLGYASIATLGWALFGSAELAYRIIRTAITGKPTGLTAVRIGYSAFYQPIKKTINNIKSYMDSYKLPSMRMGLNNACLGFSSWTPKKSNIFSRVCNPIKSFFRKTKGLFDNYRLPSIAYSC